MNAYSPSSLAAVSAIVAFIATVLLVGFLVTRIRHPATARLAAWLLVGGALIGVAQLVASEPPGVRMLALIAALLLAMKAVVCIEDQAAGNSPLPPRNWFLFALGWPGMRPATFRNVPAPRLPGAGNLVARGIRSLLAGTALIVLARLVGHSLDSGFALPSRQILATLCLLPGLSLVLHFGLFNILAGLWRTVGADSYPLFRAPLHSRSLTEFWGRRWNLAFSEMTALAVFRPLNSLFGKPAATLAAFGVSGLLHELAISFPVRAGYGLPLLYFAIQSLPLLIEKRLLGNENAFSRHTAIRRLWTALWLLLPLPLMFHPPFLEGCLWPLIGLEAEN